MRILAIDPGTHCGYALSPYESGVWDLSPKQSEGNGMRYIRLRKYLMEAMCGVDLVAYEDVKRHSGVLAAHMYGAIEAIIKELCDAHLPKPIPYIGIPVGTIKKHATGKGNAGKELMIAAAMGRWSDVKIISDDHADALWIWDVAQTEYGRVGI